ncbi:MAG: hypothetical protein R2712_12925 [Vicinamibacterales bacterium]
MSHLRAGLLAVAAAMAMAAHSAAVTPLRSADGQFWDIQDTSPWAQDSGAIATGGRANPFNGFGYLKLEVGRPGSAPTVRNQYLRGFDLAFDGESRFDSVTPVLADGVVVSRAIYAPPTSDYLRYYDSVYNSTDEPRAVRVAWGGAAGAFEDGGRVAVAVTSSGDRTIDASDTFVTLMQNARGAADPRQGPSGHGPSAHVLGTTPGVFTAAGDMYADPFANPYPGYDPAHVGYVFSLALAPGETRALATFVVKGLSEVYDPRGGFPIPRTDALLSNWSSPVYTGPDARVPAAGSEIARVTRIARDLVARPDFSGLTPRERARVANWPAAAAAPEPFTVVEQTVPALAAAMTRGEVTSADIVREHSRA